MNNKQSAYQIGRIVHEKGLMASTLFFGSVTVVNAAIGRWPQAVVEGIITGYFAILGAADQFCKNTIRKENDEIFSNPENYPIEYAEEVIISDENGLEHLLKRTKDREKREWGTVIKTVYNGDRVGIYNILDSFEAEERGFIKTRRSCSVRFDTKKAIEEGYKGYHHYHPSIMPFLPDWLNAMSYSVSAIDRFMGNVNLMNLLTFNIDGRPEVIAFNRNRTYMPLTAEDKTRLIIADHKKIMAYLE